MRRGREWFTVTKHDSGDRTIRAICEMDDTQILRDVIYTVDANCHPVDAFVRLTVAGSFMGCGWFRFTDTHAECETFTADGGRISQSIELEKPAPSFGPHPVACDIWHLGCIHGGNPGMIHEITGSFLSSPLPNGASGPMLGPLDVRAEYVGPEEITVPAGTFATHHYRFLLEDMTPEDVWFHGEDLILVRMRFDELASTYELVELEGLENSGRA